jgi:hypothetical protein
MEIVNSIIKKIGDSGRKFLYNQRHNRYGYFAYDGKTLYYIDHYTGVPMRMIKGSGHKTLAHERSFSSGGTMWGLINDFKDFIYGDDDSNHNNGYGGLYCPHWGYPEEDMKVIQKLAKELDYLK